MTPSPRRPATSIKKIGDSLRALELTQDEVDGYIASVYSGFAQAPGKMSGCSIAIRDAISGKDTFAKRMLSMQQLKAFTPEDIATYATLYDFLRIAGRKMTVGSVQAVDENRQMFELIDDHLAPLPKLDMGYRGMTIPSLSAWTKFPKCCPTSTSFPPRRPRPSMPAALWAPPRR